jgi:hypothetical protein
VFFGKKRARIVILALKKMVRSRTPSFVNGIGLKKSQSYTPPSGADLLIFGEKKLVDKKIPATTEQTILLALMSTSSIPMMEIFPSLEKYPTLCNLKSVGAL